MQVSIYDLTVPQFILSLTGLKGILRKCQGFAEAKRIDPTVLLQTRLAPDQFPLAKQIQITCDGAKFCVSRLTGVEAPVFEDKEVALDEFMNRIDKTILFLKTIKPEQFEGFEKREARFHWKTGMHLKGRNYLIQHAIPNFYFHLATAYSILRASGVELGKADFLGAQDWIADKQ